jgi:hypothetical protein
MHRPRAFSARVERPDPRFQERKTTRVPRLLRTVGWMARANGLAGGRRCWIAVLFLALTIATSLYSASSDQEMANSYLRAAEGGHSRHSKTYTQTDF